MTTDTVGIEQRGDNLLVARVHHDGGRRVVRTLARVRTDDASLEELSANARTVRAVPDTRVIVKSLLVPTGDPAPPKERGAFELATSLPEPEQAFSFDLLPTARPERWVGLAYRRTTLAELFGPLADLPDSYRMRAAALASGWLAYCRSEPGDLICLAEVGPDGVSVCFIYQKRVISLTSLGAAPDILATEQGCKHLAIELRTIANFKLAELAEQGISVPLAKLILAGSIEDGLMPHFTRLFPTGVVRPRLNEAFLQDRSQIGDIAPESFLVALGLTVD
ncbi:hypothetical protein GF420_10180 [candidate division GN15 bacterium]|nr:hypothetical protein [candidate division GN15 bacterium]